MRIPKSDQKRVTRAAMWGAGALGALGFMTGTIACLVYKIPIPPLFITEMGMILGGCFGALVALAQKKPHRAPRQVRDSWKTLS